MSQDYDYLLKLLLVGSTGAQKTEFLLRYIDDSFKINHLATLGIDFVNKIIIYNQKYF